MSKRFSLLLATLLLLACFVTTGNITPTPVEAADNCQTFPETGFQVCGKFLQYWQSHGGLAQQGFPISNVFLETNAPPPSGDGKQHKVQYFQRARFEEHTENSYPNDVLLGLLGTEQYTAKYGAFHNGTAPTQVAGCQYFSETGYNVCGAFLEYWQSHGGLAQQGFPISNVFSEKNADPPAGDGQVHQVQYFQRARFEEHLEKAPPYNVLLGLLGSEQFGSKYPGTQPPAVDPPPSYPVATPTPAPTQPPASGGSVAAAGCLSAVTGNQTVVQACVSNSDPAAGAVVTVYGRLVVNGQVAAGAQMNTTWYYKTTSPGCSATADSDGVAECSRDTGRPTKGYTVRIAVSFTYNGRSYSGSTSFTPH